jgi:pimeloyl-ACP methyl ester carboxylesterase
MRKALPAILAVTVLVAFGAARTDAQSKPLVRSDTTIRSFDGREMKGEVLRLTVPERHQRPARTLTVGALRFPTTAAKPGRPIVFLMGGPGIPGSVMAPIPPYFSLFQKLRDLGDVIIVDQRGIGLSAPRIDCPSSGTLPTNAFADTAQLISFIRNKIAVCTAVQRTRNVEPTAYSTVESADDVNALRKALGIPQIDLLAFSYGTRLALLIAQRHESSIGRMVLQGVNGPGLVVKRTGPVARKLTKINSILKLDSTWTPAPDLIDAARRARTRLAATPATVTVNDQKAGRPLQLKVGREGLDAIVALNLDDARLPALIVSVANGDDRVLTRFVENAWNGLNTSSVQLMARSVNCSADRPASRWSIAAAEAATAPFGSPIDNAFLTKRFCIAIGYPGPVKEFSSPLRSRIPSLLITGDLDATNPVENARDVATGLTNSTLLEVANVAHEALPVAAVQDVVMDFFRGTDVRGRQVSGARPHFLTITEALAPPTRRGP